MLGVNVKIVYYKVPGGCIKMNFNMQYLRSLPVHWTRWIREMPRLICVAAFVTHWSAPERVFLISIFSRYLFFLKVSFLFALSFNLF